MTASRVRRRRLPPQGLVVSRGRLSRWGVGLSAVTVGVLAVASAVFGVAYIVGGADATEDNWVGLLAAIALVGGLAMSFLAFALAVLAKAKHDPWALLWLPLCLFPTLFLIIALVEALWME